MDGHGHLVFLAATDPGGLAAPPTASSFLVTKELGTLLQQQTWAGKTCPTSKLINAHVTSASFLKLEEIWTPFKEKILMNS